TKIMSYRLLNYSDKFAPKGKCVVQAMCGGDFELDEIFPGFASQVEMTDVATPCTTFRYTRNWKGSMMGWMPTTKQMMKNLPRSLPGLNGFYMIGQWAQPGGGVSGCLMQGRHIVQILCQKDGRKFSVPSRNS
ncbi:MAG: hypothetical protein LUQ38_10340, partial [Methanotrichaceae archaeon]|nr:hypothetical protein [Methanotrichaceae archaeon]